VRLVYDPRGLSRVTTAKPRVARVLHWEPILKEILTRVYCSQTTLRKILRNSLLEADKIKTHVPDQISNIW
jgi:hypothetical protein